MAKASVHDTGATNVSAFPPVGLMKLPESFGGYCEDMIKAGGEIHRALCASAARAVDEGWETAGRLARCRGPAEVFDICREWMTSAGNRWLAESKDLTTQWFKLWALEPSASLAEIRDAVEQAASRPANPLSRSGAAS